MSVAQINHISILNIGVGLVDLIQVLFNAGGGGGVSDFRRKRYKDVRFNVIGVTRGWVGGCRISRNTTL